MGESDPDAVGRPQPLNAMDAKKVVIIVLVVLAVAVGVVLGAGALRDSREGRRPPAPESYEPGGGVKVLGRLTDPFLAPLDRSRIVGPCVDGSVISVVRGGTCEIRITPGSARPSRLRLVPRGGQIAGCFGLTHAPYRDCLDERDELEPKDIDEPADFVVAEGGAFLGLRCRGQTDCVVNVAAR